jgi:hypothetical protein
MRCVKMAVIIDTGFSEEMTEAMYKAIAKGYTCNGITGWQHVTLDSGKKIGVRFCREMR